MRLELDGYLTETSQSEDIIDLAANKTIITVSTLRSKITSDKCPEPAKGIVGFYKGVDGVYEMVYDASSVTVKEILNAVQKYKEIVKFNEEIEVVITTKDKKEQIYNV